MAKSSILHGLLNVDALEAKRAELMNDLQQIEALVALLSNNGSPRRGRKSAGRSAGRVRRGGKRGGGSRVPKEGTLGGKILAALKSGPKSNAQLLTAAKISPKKRSQLSVNLNNLKKRGFVKSAERGVWAAA